MLHTMLHHYAMLGKEYCHTFTLIGDNICLAGVYYFYFVFVGNNRGLPQVMKSTLYISFPFASQRFLYHMSYSTWGFSCVIFRDILVGILIARVW